MNATVSVVRVLLAKELRQVRRSRGALASATILPLFLITIVPLAEIVAARGAPAARGSLPTTSGLPPGMAAAAGDPIQVLVRVMLPLFIVLGGLLVPAMSATYTVVAEREKRTIELVMALPARVGDILLAKLLAMLVLAGIVVLPLFAVDAVVLLALGLTGIAQIAALLGLLISALACSVGVALLLALIARDFRTANNLNGAIVGPMVVLLMAALFLVPSPLSYLVAVALLLGVGSAAVLVALRWLTFERYLA